MTDTTPAPQVWPSLRARDARSLIAFLVEAFGFVETAVYGDGDVVHHAELAWPPGGGIMLGSSGGDDVWALEPGTFGAYAVTDDPDALYARAVGHGATVIRELDDTDYGSRGFSVRDPEGNRWSFGTYRGESQAPESQSPESRPIRPQPMIAVADVVASSEWYQRVLGGSSDHGGPEYERIVVGGQLVLQLHRSEIGHHHGTIGDPALPTGNGVALWFEADEFDEVVDRIRSVGATIETDVHVNPNAAHREIWIRDPDGYLVVIADADHS